MRGIRSPSLICPWIDLGMGEGHPGLSENMTKKVCGDAKKGKKNMMSAWVGTFMPNKINPFRISHFPFRAKSFKATHRTFEHAKKPQNQIKKIIHHFISPTEHISHMTAVRRVGQTAAVIVGREGGGVTSMRRTSAVTRIPWRPPGVAEGIGSGAKPVPYHSGAGGSLAGCGSAYGSPSQALALLLLRVLRRGRTEVLLAPLLHQVEDLWGRSPGMASGWSC